MKTIETLKMKLLLRTLFFFAEVKNSFHLIELNEVELFVEIICENENDPSRTRPLYLYSRSGSVLEYKSRGRGFESYSGHFHSH